MSKIGDRIKQRRKEKGYTLEQVSKLIGVTTSTISKYEKGLINIPSNKIEELAKVLKCSPAYFMGWEKKEEESLESVVTKFKDFNSLLNYFKEKYSLSEGEQQELEKILQFNVLLFKDTDITVAGKKKLKITLLEIYVEALLETRKKEGR